MRIRSICEALERRTLLTGTWSAVTNLAPNQANNDGVSLMMLLSDGTVMAHAGAGDIFDPAHPGNVWYKLTPVNGSYVNGTWSTLSPMVRRRQFFASNVLPDGRVLVLGGEYSDDPLYYPANPQNLTATGEIYNPYVGAGGTWNNVASFPEPGNFGDSSTALLPDGRILAGARQNNAHTYIYNPATNVWVPTADKLRNDQGDEENWVKLPDDSVLSYDIAASIDTGVGHSQRYVPASNTWVDSGTLPFLLTVSTNWREYGPPVLLPDGRAWFQGSNGNTAYYRPPTNDWIAGPPLPPGLGANDNPAAMLPNGKVLIALNPSGNFNPPVTVYEFDPATGIYTDVTPGTAKPAIPGFDLSARNTDDTCMLVLPTGQILLSNNTGKLALYTPDGAPSDAWRPTISNIDCTGMNLFTLTGTQLNGISEGASYGDDNEMSSNYPIVQITDAAGNISYARSFNWSSTGVATGSTPVSTQFSLTTGTVQGGHLVRAIANGIASSQALLVQGTTANDLIVVGPNGGNTQVTVNGVVQNFASSAFTQIIVSGGDGNDIIRIEGNSGKPTITNGGIGDEFFDFSFSLRDLDNIAGNVNVNGGPGNDGIFVYDDNNAAAATYSITDARFDRPGWGGFFYAGDVERENLITGVLADTVNVFRTFPNQPVNLDSAGGADVVNVGNTSNGLQSIIANVAVDNSAGLTTLNISDQGDSIARTGNVGVVFGSLGVLLGMTGGGSVLWNTAHVAAVNITSGSGADTLNVESTNNNMTLSSTGGGDLVNVGNSSNGVLSITGSITVLNPPSFTTLTVDDTADITPRNISLDTVSINGSLHGRISGLAPAQISYRINDVTSPITINAGSGGDTFTVLSTPASRTLALNLGAGADTINIQNTGTASSIDLNMGSETDTANIFETATNAQVRVIPAAGDDSVYVNPDGAGFAAVRFDSTQRLGVLGVATGGIARLTANANQVLTTASLVLIGSGAVDMTNNDMIVDYLGASPISDIQNSLASGYNGGAWNGSGIQTSLGNASTFSLGYAEAFQGAPGGTFSGQTVDSTAVLIKYTYYADANLNGEVEVGDLGLLASSWQMLNSRWFSGNFNYDNATNVADLGLLASNWQLGVGSPLGPVPKRRTARLDSITGILLDAN
jgi:hypothetical protein